MTTSMNEWTRFFMKNIPLTLYSRKGCERVDVGYVWEVSWRWRQTATYWPQVPLTIAALLSHSGWATQPEVTEGPSPLSGAGSHSVGILSLTATGTELELIPTDCLKPSVARGYIIVWHPPASCGRMHLHRIQPRSHVKGNFQYLRLDAPVSSLDWRLGRGSICNTYNVYILPCSNIVCDMYFGFYIYSLLSRTFPVM